MATASRNPSNSLDERLFPLIQVLERPVAERPQHDTLEGIMDWLAGPVQQVGVPSLIGEFDEFAWRMLAAGFPLLRATLQLRTLHPQYLGANFVWWRTTGRTVSYYVTHEAQDLYGHEDNPVRRVLVGGQTIRRRIDVSDDKLDFPILHDLKAEGATDYFALPIKSHHGLSAVARRQVRHVRRRRVCGLRALLLRGPIGRRYL